MASRGPQSSAPGSRATGVECGWACAFCQSLEAELISVAGQYLLADEIPAQHRGAATQLWVQNGQFRLQAL